MYKFISKVLIVALIGTIVISAISIGFNLKNKNNQKYEIIAKGLDGAEDFVKDEVGNTYISRKGSITKIDKYNVQEIILDDWEIMVRDMAYNNRNLFYLHDDKLNRYSIDENKHYRILDDIPSYGDYYDNKLLFYNNELYLTVGSATNSGVVGDDNKWDIKNNSDKYPVEVKIKERKFNNNYPFVKSGEVYKSVINETAIGNSGIYKVDIDSKTTKLIAYGARNVEGIDFDSNGQIFMIVGGIENRGSRPLEGDCDYIYKLNNDSFYGWPDYTGGDKVDSYVFRGNNKLVKPILDEEIKAQAPDYKHDNVSSLYNLCIDRKGEIQNKDSLFVFDKSKGKIINVDKFGAKTTFLDIKEGFVETMKIYDSELYVLESKEGILFKVSTKFNVGNVNFSYIILTFLIFLILFFIVIGITYIKKYVK